MSARKAFALGAIVGAGVLAAALVGVGLAARQGDGGSGSYGGPGTTVTLNVVNSGTTDWQYIVFVLPSGSSFLSAQVTAGGTAPCSVGSFVPGSGELECGGFSPVVPPNGQVTVTATINAPVTPCGSPVQFWVNSTGKPPYTRASDLTFSGSCGGPKNCDEERAAVAAAKAKLAAAEEVLRAATIDVERATKYHKEFEKELTTIEIANQQSGGLVALLGALTDAQDAESSAWNYDKGPALYAEKQASDAVARAKSELAAWERELATCEGRPLSAFTQPARANLFTACSQEQALLAASQARAGELASGLKRLTRNRARAVETSLHRAITRLQNVLTTPVRQRITRLLTLARATDAILIKYVRGLDRLSKSAKTASRAVVKARTALAKCEGAPPSASISEADTWTYNTSIGKGNICINVRTTPPQASISASVTGPSNYKASLPKTPLHPDGTRQVGAEITRPGAYTKTLTVYDATGKETATVTKTFTVAAPPQNGPATTPPCPKPTR